MANFVRKTFDNSYFFNQEVEKHHRNLTEFIIKTERIDKNSAAFKGIIEEVKRRQSSSILVDILLMKEVVLCINNIELPRAFKVFEANDLRLKDGPKVFIDVTGLVEFKDGYFLCKKIDVLITYLFGALTYLLYQKEPVKMVNNSNLSISGTECFVAMFTYIIDYLRIIGFAANKNKIAYLTGLYFLHNMMGKDLDMYTKNIAAKIAGIAPNEIKVYDLYFNEGDFRDIDTFINLITTTFKLKGLTTEVFIQRWIYLFGAGTQFGAELFTSFSVILTNAYCGSYIVNQKQIERCCGRSMVQYATSLLRMGVDVFDKRGFMETAEFEKVTYVVDKATANLRESFLSRNKTPDNIKFTDEVCVSKSKAKNTAKEMIKYYESSNQKDKISSKATQNILKVFSKLEDSEIGTLEAVLSCYKSYLTDSDKRKIADKLDKHISKLENKVESNKDKDKDVAQKASKCLISLRKCKGYV